MNVETTKPLVEAPTLNLETITGCVHLVGIGGIGMSAIARLLLAKGIKVSGSDKERSAITDELQKLGARICIGHKAENIEGVDLVVVSTAINTENPELSVALKKNLPVWHRSKLLAYLGKDSRVIAISGTHGKTTTTGMVAQVLLHAQLDPTVVVGGIFSKIGSNACLGKGDYLVEECDESDGTHAKTHSYLSLITNIEADHLENYPGGLEQIRDEMVTFANNSSFGTILCQDDAGCRLVRNRITGKVITYGTAKFSRDADYRYESLPGFGLKVWHKSKELGEINLQVPGEHNKLNALSAVVVGTELGVPFELIAQALAGFTGVGRRFQIIGSTNDLTVIDDYAHHPTEVVATLQAARAYKLLAHQNAAPKGRIVAVFQPHQPGRLRDFWTEFCQAFEFADLVLISDVYIARGSAIEGINSEKLAASITHPHVFYLPGATNTLAQQIVPHLMPGDLVITMGAGDITKVGSEILALARQGLVHGRSN